MAEALTIMATVVLVGGLRYFEAGGMLTQREDFRVFGSRRHAFARHAGFAGDCGCVPLEGMVIVLPFMRAGREARTCGIAGRGGPPVRLFSCSIVDGRAQSLVHAFCAMVAVDEVAFRRHLTDRFGSKVSDDAQVREGWDPGDPIAVAMVSEAIAEILGIVAADPGSALASGLNIVLEQRFEA